MSMGLYDHTCVNVLFSIRHSTHRLRILWCQQGHRAQPTLGKRGIEQTKEETM